MDQLFLNLQVFRLEQVLHDLVAVFELAVLLQDREDEREDLGDVQ